MPNYIFSKYFPSIIAAFLCSITFIIYIPLVSYLTNINEFSFNATDLLISLLPYLCVLFLVVSSLLILTNKCILKSTLCRNTTTFAEASLLDVLVMTVVFSTWLEGFLLSYNLPKLTGETNIFPLTSPRLAIDTFVWISVFLAVIVFRKFFIKRFAPISLAIAFLLILGIADGVISKDIRIIPTITREHVLDRISFNAKNNVLFMVLDATSTALLQDYLKNNPQAKEEFGGFVVFQNNMQSATSTQWALPSILKGDMYLGGSATQYQQEAFDADSSLIKQFAQQGYTTYASSILPMFNNIKQDGQNLDLHVDSTITMNSQLYSQLYVRFAPYILKNTIANSAGYKTTLKNFYIRPDGNLSAIAKTDSPSDDALTYEVLLHAVAKKGSDKPTFHFHHVNGSHQPYIVDNKGSALAEKERYTLFGLHEQSTWTFNYVIKLLASMKENNIYNPTTIVFLGDHGDRLYGENRSNLLYAKQPVLLIKPAKHTDELSFSLAPTSNMYLAELIPKLHLESQSLNSLTANLPATRNTFYSDDSLITIYKGQDVTALSVVESRPVEQTYTPTALKADTKYYLALLGSEMPIAYPLPGENVDFTNAWGLKLISHEGQIDFKLQRKGLCDIKVEIETAQKGGGFVEFAPYSLTFTDTVSKNSYPLIVGSNIQAFTLRAAQVPDTNILSLGYSLSSYKEGLHIFVKSIQINYLN